MVKGESPESIVLSGGAQALQMRSFLSSLMSSNGEHLFPVIPGLSRKAKERSGEEEGKKPSTERPYAPCLRDEAWLLGWEDAAGFTPDLAGVNREQGDAGQEQPGSEPGCCARTQQWSTRAFGEEWGGQGLPNTELTGL